MKPHSENFKVVNPRTIEEIVDVLNSSENALPLAGGTDLYVSLRNDQFDSAVFINLKACEELDGKPVFKDDELVFDALTTFKQVRYDENIEQKFPLLIRAAELVSTLGIQSRATWAGNIANASPCGNG
ncbi:MAG: FAD binding domain-containing protein, partial [bacterium]